MDIRITPQKLHGTVAAVPSKSDLHRALICAAFADAPTAIFQPSPAPLSQDIEATIACLRAMGAEISVFDEKELPVLEDASAPGSGAASESAFAAVSGNASAAVSGNASAARILVTPVRNVPDKVVLHCGESGSTARFMLPVAAAVCKEAVLTGSGRLPERPMSPLTDELARHGCSISSPHLPMTVSGGFSEKTADSSVNTEIPEFSLPGSISSQFITGLLLAAPLTGGVKIHLTTPLASASYVDMTIDTMGRFGVHVKKTDDGFEVASGSYRSPGTYMTDGGWSSAAFFIAADVLSAGSAGPVSVTGLRRESLQGDRAIERIADHFYTLKNRGRSTDAASSSLTESNVSDAAFTSEKNAGNPDMTIIDAENIPDLVPIIAVLAALTPGRTHIINAARLRLKESDRLRATSEMLSTLGADIVEEPGGLMITGKERLEGGTVSGSNDHRIVMSAAIASIGCRKEVTILGAEAVAKSYPSFWEDFRKLGGTAILFA